MQLVQLAGIIELNEEQTRSKLRH